MKVCIFAYCFLAVTCISAFACISTIEMAYYAVDAGGRQSVSLGCSTYNGANGVMVMNTRNPIGELANLVGDHIWTYCYDHGAYSSFSYATFNVLLLQDAMNSDKANLIRQLWALHYDDSWESDTYIYRGGSYGGFVSGQPANTVENQEALAFSFAVYEITYDFNGSIGSLNLSNGSLVANVSGTNPAAAVAIAQGWLSSLILPCDYDGPLAQLVSLSNCSLQDVIVEIPEPATMALLSLGLLILRKK